jgi:DNA invertase Pin-like site-specific DNA recombinase
MTPRRPPGSAVPAAPADKPAALRCAIYTRKSDSAGLEQEFSSIDAQRETCELFILSQGHRGWKALPDRYDDGGFTGANLDRPAFRRLQVDIEAGKVDVLVVHRVDRLSRSLLDFVKLMETFTAKGVTFVSVTQNFTTADAMGRLVLNLLMSFAEFEREMIAERTRDKIAAARRRGMWTGGQVALGYDIVQKKLVVNEAEAIVAREIFAAFIEHRSIVAVIRLLNERGRTTKRHQAESGRTRAAHPWTKDAVLRVLKNPIFAGLIRAGEKLVAGAHQALIDMGTWEKAQALLSGRAPIAAPVRNPAYFLRGILRCAACGAAMTPASTRREDAEYRYYRCLTRDKEGVGACPTKPLPAGPIEDHVVGRVREATADGRLAADVAARLAERVGAERAELQAERQTLPGAIARLSAEGRRLAEAAGATDGAARRLIEERLRNVGEDLAAREARLAAVERRLGALTSLEVEGAWVERALREFDGMWELLTLDNRARLVRAVVTAVEIDQAAGQVTVRLADLSDVAGRLRPSAAPDGREGAEALESPPEPAAGRRGAAQRAPGSEGARL